MDYADKASAAETKHRSLSLAALKRRAAAHNVGQPVLDRSLPLTCLDCGAPIPGKRRLAQPGCEYCLACQAIREEKETT